MFSQFPLGKLAPVRNPAAVQIMKQALRTHMPAPPTATYWVKPGDTYPMFLNDQIGCCAESEKANLALHFSRVAQAAITWPDASVEKLYEICGGYVPGDPSTDKGTVMANVNGYMASTGIDIGLQAPEVYTLALPIDHTDVDDICRAIAVFGGVSVGWQLTQAMYTSTTGVWDCVQGSPVVGGHAAPLIEYKTVNGQRVFSVPTWTQLISATEAAVRASVDEVWLCVSRQHWTTVRNLTPLGTTFDSALNYAKSLVQS